TGDNDSAMGGQGDWIKNGWWPYSLDRDVPFKPRPLAPPWDTLPAPAQSLFLRCFDRGHNDPESRPTAKDCRQALTECEGPPQECSENRPHSYSSQSEVCPWCRMAKEQGRDPLPLAPSKPTLSAAATTMSEAAPVSAASPPVAKRRSGKRGAAVLLLS